MIANNDKSLSFALTVCDVHGDDQQGTTYANMFHPTTTRNSKLNIWQGQT